MPRDNDKGHIFGSLGYKFLETPKQEVLAEKFGEDQGEKTKHVYRKQNRLTESQERYTSARLNQ